MTVDYFSFSYCLMILLVGLVTVFCLLFLKKRSPKFQKWFIFFLLLSAFSLHFMKQFFEPYQSNLPAGLRHSTFENICAVSVLIFPWIFLSKSEPWKDYMFYIGILSGIGAMIIPTEALGKELLSFDVLRFYYVHMVIFLAPLLMVNFKQHKLNYRRVYRLPLSFIIILGIIIVNEVVLIAIGFVESDMATFLNQNDRNSSFIFGPTEYFKDSAAILNVLVPSIFRKPLIGPSTNTTVYWPIIWLVIPLYVYLPLLGIVVSLPYEYQHIKEDLNQICHKICPKRISKNEKE